MRFRRHACQLETPTAPRKCRQYSSAGFLGLTDAITILSCLDPLLKDVFVRDGIENSDADYSSSRVDVVCVCPPHLGFLRWDNF